MTVRRIVANFATENMDEAAAFYTGILGLERVMDHGWIQTFAGKTPVVPQLSVASEGGSGTLVPDLSVEVDNFDEIHRRVVDRGLPIEYGPVCEPWGVRRFYVRDPFDRLINILMHE